MRAVFIALVLLSTLGSCTPRYHNYDCYCPEGHEQLPTYKEENRRRARVALVLGAGGARGMAHLGVLHELEEAGVKVDLIVGCSAGSIVGALYANTPSIERIKPVFDALTSKELLDFNIFSYNHGLCYGEGLSAFLARELGEITFEELKIPLAVVVTDLVSGNLVVFNSGKVRPAVHASSALPFIYSPVAFNNYLFVDGGVADPLPVGVASGCYGAELIIAVDIGRPLPIKLPTNIFGVVKRCAEIQMHRSSLAGRSTAHFLINPDLTSFGTIDDTRKAELYTLGREAAKPFIGAITAAIAASEQRTFPKR